MHKLHTAYAVAVIQNGGEVQTCSHKTDPAFTPDEQFEYFAGIAGVDKEDIVEIVLIEGCTQDTTDKIKVRSILWEEAR